MFLLDDGDRIPWCGFPLDEMQGLIEGDTKID